MNEKYVLDAETRFAGALLVSPKRVLTMARGLCAAEDFSDDRARTVFNITADLEAAGKPVDPTLVQAEAAARGIDLSDTFLAAAMSSCASVEVVEELARLIREESEKRSARAIGQALAFGELDAVTAIGQLQKIVKGRGSGVLSPFDAANAFLDEMGAPDGVGRTFLSTGYRSLDEQLGGGLVSGGMIVIAARTGIGKTNLAVNIAERVASANGAVLYVSLEMPSSQLWSMRCAAAAGLPRGRIYNRTLDDADFPRLTDAVAMLSERPFYILDAPSSVADIAREAACIENLSLIVLDHLQLIKGTANGSPYERMTAVSHSVKQLALSLRVPILALSQLSRGPETRMGNRPTLADLRDSGAIEEDADAVCLLFRPAAYLPDDEKPQPWEAQTLEVSIAKNRHAPVGGVKLEFYGITARIV